MNPTLTDEEIDFICRGLQKKGLNYRPLEGELIDHICCAVETEMDSGLPFQQAYAKVMERFGPDGVEDVQTRTLQLIRRPVVMKRLALYSSAVAASLFLVVLVGKANASNRPDIDPVFSTSKGIYRQIHVCPNENLDIGVDYLIPEGTPVIATSEGKIEKISDDQSGYGKNILLRHDAMYVTRYAHLSEYVVYTGQKVKKGEVIGYAGKTGDAVEPHLHYEVIRNGKCIDTHPIQIHP